MMIFYISGGYNSRLTGQPLITGTIKSHRLRWAGNVTRAPSRVIYVRPLTDDLTFLGFKADCGSDGNTMFRLMRAG